MEDNMKKFGLMIVALIVVAGVALFLNLGGAIKKTIEVVGSQTLGTAVRVAGVHFSLADKSAGLSGLTIRNPGGFKEAYLLKTKDISVKVADVTQEVVSIDEILVEGMTVTYELGASGTNVDVIKRNIKASASSSSQASQSGKKGPDVIIKKIRIVNAEVIPALGGAVAPVKLPEIIVSNIGSKAAPANPAKVASQIIGTVLAVSSQGIAKAGLNEALSGALKGAAPVGDAVKDVSGKLNDLLKQ